MQLSRRVVLLSSLAASAVRPEPAESALPVIDVAGLGQWVQQTFTQVKQLAQQVMSYVTQLQQYANMVQNTIALPMQVWGTVQSDIMQVRSIANAASLLTGNTGSIIGRLQAAGGYAGTLTMMPQNMGAQFTMWQTTLGNDLTQFGRVLGLEDTQRTSDAALLAAIQAHSQTAAGQMQALQAGNELAHATATELLQLQQTLAELAQLQAQQAAIAGDRQARSDQALQSFLAAPPLAAKGNPSY